jgi:RNA polymerase sigma-70 factor (ECF subfamily)
MTVVPLDSDGVVPSIPASPLAAAASSVRAGAATTDLFVSVYEHWFGKVRQWTRALAADGGDEEDLAQSVFLIVLRRLGEFDGRNLAGWLYTITANQVRDQRRLAWTRGRAYDSETALAEMSSVLPTPAEVAETGEQLEALAEIVGRLEAKSRTAFLLFTLDQHTSTEIAVLQRAPLNTVHARIKRSRKTVTGRMAEWAGAPARESPLRGARPSG